MKKRLTEAQFQAAIRGLEIGQQTIDIARGVLVEAVSRVWAVAGEVLPQGFARVTAVLPEHQAFIVKRWEADAKGKRKQEPNS